MGPCSKSELMKSAPLPRFWTFHIFTRHSFVGASTPMLKLLCSLQTSFKLIKKYDYIKKNFFSPFGY